jgi:hypothetical protein
MGRSRWRYETNESEITLVSQIGHFVSVCDMGASRWFNYYVEGAYRSVSSAPHMDGMPKPTHPRQHPVILYFSNEVCTTANCNDLLYLSRTGIYYDGINFDRLSMQRLRRTLNAAASARSSELSPAQEKWESAQRKSPLVDIHTGCDKISPPSLAYLSHFAFADSAWNGEGFVWANGPDYWLVEN